MQLVVTAVARADGCGPADLAWYSQDWDAAPLDASPIVANGYGFPGVRVEGLEGVEVGPGEVLGLADDQGCHPYSAVSRPAGGWPPTSSFDLVLDVPVLGTNERLSLTTIAEASGTSPDLTVHEPTVEALGAIAIMYPGGPECCFRAERVTVEVEVAAADPWSVAYARVPEPERFLHPQYPRIFLFDLADGQATVSWLTWVDEDGVRQRECMDVGARLGNGADASEAVCRHTGCGCSGLPATSGAWAAVVALWLARRRPEVNPAVSAARSPRRSARSRPSSGRRSGCPGSSPSA